MGNGDIAVVGTETMGAGIATWAQQWGTATVLAILDAVEDWYRDGHHRASPLLGRNALSGRPLS